MIIGWLLKLVGIILTWVISLLPDAGTGLPTAIRTAFTAVFGYINAFSFIIPFSDLVVALGILVGFEFIVMSWKVFNWVLTKLRG